MLQRLIGEDIDLVTNLDPKLEIVEADPGQIEQVIMNLAVNARDAMPHGGKLLIETSNVDLNGKKALEHEGMRPGSYVVLTISDNGAGMDGKTQSRIFEPFFSTKKLGKGTGLGLSTVYGIIKQTGGHIEVLPSLAREQPSISIFPRPKRRFASQGDRNPCLSRCGTGNYPGGGRRAGAPGRDPEFSGNMVMRYWRRAKASKPFSCMRTIRDRSICC